MKTLIDLKLFILKERKRFEEIQQLENLYNEKKIQDKSLLKLYILPKEDIDFYDFYKSIQILIECSDCNHFFKPLVEEYLQIPKNNTLEQELWGLKFDEINSKYLYKTCFEEVNIIYDNYKPIAIKPSNTNIYKKKPFLLSKKGFENIINCFIIRSGIGTHYTYPSYHEHYKN